MKKEQKKQVEADVECEIIPSMPTETEVNVCMFYGQIRNIIDNEKYIIINLRVKYEKYGRLYTIIVPIWFFGRELCEEVRENAVVGECVKIAAHIQNKDTDNNNIEIAVVANDIIF